MNYDVIVIGAGNGGLSSATKLALKGKKVLVLEKHNIPGGCGTSFRRGRFEFEVALHQLSSMGSPENPGPLRKLFKEYGIEDKIDWVPIESLYKINLPGGFEQSLPADREKAEQVLCKRFPKEKENILNYFKTVFAFSDETEQFIAMQGKASGEPGTFKKFITKTLFRKKFPTLAKYGLRSSQDVLDEFFKTKELQLCLNAYWCFMGMPPNRFPFSILARCTAIYISDKPYYLRGGSQVISQALADVIRNNGGVVKYNCGAKQIVVKDGAAVGVIDDENNEYSCHTVISGISPIDTYFKLIKPEDCPVSAKEYLSNYTVGISALTCFIGLDCTPHEIGFTDSFNLIYAHTDCNEAFQNSYKLMPDKDPLITTCYTIDDPSLSPAGTSIITAGALKYGKAWMELSSDEYYQTKYEAANIIIDRLEEKFPGIRSHIEEIEVATPLTHMRYLHHPEGAIYGFEQDLKSSVYFFPRDNQVKNLTFSNGWVNICGFGPNYMYGNAIADEILSEV
ncbi:phytoene desaturase family protein [Clostridium amazonitimonense]|uniref:phytoene desaturase family protein n=1 Tax=Clostridium amazonitimonense TaxID=1499689 RepID=UPI000509ACF0|nr:NAD(P)/FAD-dependent oxidoreductase [Clostridium amazonitimonense]